MARSRWGGADFSDLEKLRDRIENFDNRRDQFFRDAAKELAARLLTKVIKRTPVGQYTMSSGKKGGALRRGWTGGKGANASAYANSLKVNHFGGVYVIEIVNPIEYASYVEFGHRTRNHKGWVRGRFMMTISEQEIKRDAPKILERKLEKELRDIFT